tara:strand:- start:99266 stop:100501 length:1236 start_codon:yes stop_codon:yes gene_type:complete
MKKLIWIALVLAAAAWFGTNLESDPGIVIVRAAGWRVDIPLWLAGFGLLFVLLSVHYVIKLYGWIFHSSYFVGDYAQKRKMRRARRLTNQGFIELAEGDWHKAEKHFLQGAQNSEVPLLNYLSAAEAAQELGEAKRRDKYLKIAHETTEGTDIAIGLTQARLQYQQGQYEQSLATVKHLLSLAPHHPHILKLLKNIYLELKDWMQLLTLLPTLRKNKVISAEEESALEKQMFSQLLQEHSKGNGKNAEDIWQKIPKRLQLDPQIVYPYAQFLNESGKILEFESLLRQTLKRSWSEKLIRLYGMAAYEEKHIPLDQAESWLRGHQDSPNLLLTLGRLCVQAQLWGKAQRYLEASLKIAPTPEAYAALGILLEKVDQKDLSLQYFRKGLIEMAPNSTLLEANQDVLVLADEKK